MRIEKYPFSLVGNIYETPAPFDIAPSNELRRKMRKCMVRSSGSAKKHLMVVLSATADRQMLPPMIIFRGKTNQTISNLDILPSFIVKTQKRPVWMTI